MFSRFCQYILNNLKLRLLVHCCVSVHLQSFRKGSSKFKINVTHHQNKHPQPLLFWDSELFTPMVVSVNFYPIFEKTTMADVWRHPNSRNWWTVDAPSRTRCKLENGRDSSGLRDASATVTLWNMQNWRKQQTVITWCGFLCSARRLFWSETHIDFRLCTHRICRKTSTTLSVAN